MMGDPASEMKQTDIMDSHRLLHRKDERYT